MMAWRFAAIGSFLFNMVRALVSYPSSAPGEAAEDDLPEILEPLAPRTVSESVRGIPLDPAIAEFCMFRDALLFDMGACFFHSRGTQLQ